MWVCCDRCLEVGHAYARLVGHNASHMYPNLVAKKVDMPCCCANLDPMPGVPTEHADMLRDLAKLFPRGLDRLPSDVPFRAGARD